MNLLPVRLSTLLQGIPRVSGDEPYEYITKTGKWEYSPRERG